MRGGRVLLLGAGGAARAVLAVLEDAGAAGITILNRSPERADALISRFSNGSLALDRADGVEAVRGMTFDLVVNATSLGLHRSDPLPLHADQAEIGAALDLVYSPGETPWVRSLRESGVRAADGMEMLVQQAGAAFRLWWGRPASLEAMREALRARA